MSTGAPSHSERALIMPICTKLSDLHANVQRRIVTKLLAASETASGSAAHTVEEEEEAGGPDPSLPRVGPH